MKLRVLGEFAKTKVVKCTYYLCHACPSEYKKSTAYKLIFMKF